VSVIKLPTDKFASLTKSER